MAGPRHILAITACPTGIAHTFMAAENLEAAARELGDEIKVETHGSIGVENAFTQADIDRADGIIVAADKQIDLSRFAGKRVLSTGVSAGIRRPKELIEEVLDAPVQAGGSAATADEAAPAARAGNGLAGDAYRALMNGVSHMIPFVVAGGLMIAVALSLGGDPTPKGLVVPEGSFWNSILGIGSLAFSLMVPVLSGYIAYALGDRPALAPGMITGYIATTGSLYHSEAGAGFLGGIVTGFATGYLVRAIKRIKVHRYVAPIMPIIVIPVLATTIVGLLFVKLIGAPIAGFFTFLTHWLGGMSGTSVLLLGAILGAMVAFDMGGPVNKTAFLFGGGLIASGNAAPMGMVAAAIAVPPLGMGLATLLRRSWFTPQERDSGIASLFMGFFGITEGAIPFAAARPLQVIPANVAGGAVAAGLAGLFGVKDNVMHGGPIVAVLGAVEKTGLFFLAVLAGLLVTAAVALALMGVQRRRVAAPAAVAVPAGAAVAAPTPAAAPAPVTVAAPGAPASTGATSEQPAPAKRGSVPIREYLRPEAVLLDVDGLDRDGLVRRLAEAGVTTGQVADPQAVVDEALAREAKGTTGVGGGIAIPHAKSDGVTRPFIGFARPRGGVDWQAMDGNPAELVFLIGVPEAQAGSEHLRILAALSRAVMKPDVRAGLAGARTPDEVLDVLGGAIG